MASHHSVTSSIRVLVLVAKSRCKKLSLCKDSKTSGVAVCDSWSHRHVKTQQPCRPQLWGEAIRNVSLYDLGDCFLGKGDLRQLQKCDSKSPVISWKTLKNTSNWFLANRLGITSYVRANSPNARRLKSGATQTKPAYAGLVCVALDFSLWAFGLFALRQEVMRRRLATNQLLVFFKVFHEITGDRIFAIFADRPFYK